MGWPQFLAWAATQGFKNIKVLRQAYNSFKKLPPKEVILKRAKNLYDDLIKKTPTKNIADKIRQDMKVKPIKVPEQTKNILNIKSTLKGRPVKVVPERPFTGFVPKVVKPKLQLEKSKQIIEGMKPKEGIVNLGERIIKKMQQEGKNVTFDDIIRIYGPKKPPGKQEGGRIGFDEGGGIEEVWDKPSIDKARKSLEESKPKLMEESYNLLIDFLNRKQEELDIGIMESAGGLGGLLGEGGRAGFQMGSAVGKNELIKS